MTTPAQAYGHPDFVTDVPIQGPTDQGLREASCRFAQTKVPKKPSCVDCGDGPVPVWTRNSLCPGTNQGQGSGIAGLGGISYGGRAVAGFAIGKAGDPDVFAALSPDQQNWIMAALSQLNDRIVQTTGSSCPTWGLTIGAATNCFQVWYTANYAPPNGPANPLRLDGVFDEDTLCALLGITGSYPLDFINVFPDPAKQHCQGPAAVVPPPPPVAPPPAPAVAPVAPAPPAPPAPTPAAPVAPAAIIPPAPTTPAATTKILGMNLTKGEMIGAGAVGVVAIGGILYAVTRKK